MSMAINAKNAKQRAIIACNIIKKQENIFTRCFDDCFEMGDGNEVMNHIIEKTKKDMTLAKAILLKCPSLGYGEYNTRLQVAINQCLILD